MAKCLLGAGNNKDLKTVVKTLSGLPNSHIKSGNLDVLFNRKGNLELFLFGTKTPSPVEQCCKELWTVYRMVIQVEVTISVARRILFNKLGPNQFYDPLFTWEDSRFKILISVLDRWSRSSNLERVKNQLISPIIYATADRSDSALLCTEAQIAVSCFLYGTVSQLKNLGTLAQEIYMEIDRNVEHPAQQR